MGEVLKLLHRILYLELLTHQLIVQQVSQQINLEEALEMPQLVDLEDNLQQVVLEDSNQLEDQLVDLEEASQWASLKDLVKVKVLDKSVALHLEAQNYRLRTYLDHQNKHKRIIVMMVSSMQEAQEKNADRWRYNII